MFFIGKPLTEKGKWWYFLNDLIMIVNALIETHGFFLLPKRNAGWCEA